MKKKKKASLAYRQERRGAVPHFAKKIRAEQAQRSVSSENYRRRDSWILRPPQLIFYYIYIYIYITMLPSPFS